MVIEALNVSGARLMIMNKTNQRHCPTCLARLQKCGHAVELERLSSGKCEVCDILGDAS